MSASVHRLDLPALDGANPLGFLAALGTLAALSETDPTVRLGWQAHARWMPFLQGQQPLNENSIVATLVEKLAGKPVDTAAEKKRAEAQKGFDAARKSAKDAQANLKKRKLRGAEREAAWATEIKPLKQAERGARDGLLAALKQAVPSPELALGQRPDCTVAEYREHASSMRTEATPARRTSADLLAAFGVEPYNVGDERISPTPFCFITGSGHQWFLDTARQLMAAVSETKVREALFEPWAYRDEKLTMRWDPLDDRRYALLDRDPTASDNKSSTVWMANLLAYRALALFPCAPIARGLVTAGWSGDRVQDCFTWPLWNLPLGVHTVRSLLRHPAFAETNLAAFRPELRARGVVAVFQARRLQVGNPPLHKINFSPAVAR
jgi:hypothetical protein